MLVGEFQGGKSTTFNALCDGREISPRGALIKTSACRISAHNLAKHEDAEYARVTWKTDIELLKTIIDLVAPGIRQAQPRRFPENIPNAVMIGEISPHEISGLPKEFRPLTFAKDVGLLKSVLNDEWQEFQENPVAYDKISAGRQDMLYIATLIVDHCASRVIKGLSSRQSEEMAIEEMAKYVRFPANWESRWSNYSPSSFSDEEVLFAFVARVDCFIHSENLGKLGCVVTDCPGLFASDWDTRVATDAMKSAHAIAYLFGGERALSSQELVALQHIRSLGLEDNLFYVFNAHTRIGQAKDTIVPADESILRNQGYRLGNRIAKFNSWEINGSPVTNANFMWYWYAVCKGKDLEPTSSEESEAFADIEHLRLDNPAEKSNVSTLISFLKGDGLDIRNVQSFSLLKRAFDEYQNRVLKAML